MSPLLTSTVLALSGGRLVVSKRRIPDPGAPGGRIGDGTGGDAVLATRREARWLSAARVPGVVTLRCVDGDRLETVLAATATLRTLGPALGGDPVRAVALLAAVAAAVDRLHRHRLVHGRIQADHVIVGGRDLDRVWLCSPSGSNTDPGVDIAGIAALARDLTADWVRVPGWLRRLLDDLDELGGDAGQGRSVPPRRLARALVAGTPRPRRGIRTAR